MFLATVKSQEVDVVETLNWLGFDWLNMVSWGFFWWSIWWPAHVLFGTTSCHYVWGLVVRTRDGSLILICQRNHRVWLSRQSDHFAECEPDLDNGNVCYKNMLLHFALKKIGWYWMHFSIPLCDFHAVVTQAQSAFDRCHIRQFPSCHDLATIYRSTLRCLSSIPARCWTASSKKKLSFSMLGSLQVCQKVHKQYLQHLQTTPETRNWCVGGMGTLLAGFTAICASVTKSCSFMVCYQFFVLNCLFWISFSFSRSFRCFCINESMLHLTCWPYYILVVITSPNLAVPARILPPGLICRGC